MIIPKEIEKLIFSYKDEFNKYKKQLYKIDYLLYKNSIIWLEVDLDYLDFKEYLITKHEIYNIRYRIKDLYGENHPNNLLYWGLNFIKDDDQILEELRVKSIIYSHRTNLIYAKFE